MTPVAKIDDGVAMFEMVNVSVPDIAGQNIANPSAISIASVMMLEYLGELNTTEN